MGCTPAAACKALLTQATARWPRRSRGSDGICPSAAHTTANPTSDHELGNAVDLTHDPDSGCDAHAWAEALRLRGDQRVKYVISRRRIWTPAISPHWRDYSGTNPHETHVHVSIHRFARNDASPWFIDPPPAPAPPPNPITLTTEDADMFIAWDPNNAWLVFRDATTGSLVRTHLGDLAEVVAAETALQGGKRLVLPKTLARIPATS